MREEGDWPRVFFWEKRKKKEKLGKKTSLKDHRASKIPK
jgi:hypothetical protein